MVPIMNCKDIESRGKIEHIDFKTLEALLKGYIVESSEHGEFRYATKDQELWKITNESDIDNELVYCATSNGFYKRFYTYDSSMKGAEYTKENASGFKWILATENIETMLSIIRTMTKEEKLKVSMDMSFENVVGSMHSR